VTVDITNIHRTKHIDEKAIRKLIHVMAAIKRNTPFEFLSLVFMDNSGIRKINRKYLKHNYATDVISFDLSDSKAVHGEIYVSLDKAAAQAKQFGVTYADEVLRLTAHGILHILGYDDRTAAQRQRMLTLGDRCISMIPNKI
jgi:probable rRNA maturation factor